ncbi:CDP-alcohol phosphatidyltransferase family protein [Cryomorphaceae bacterium 1068]|nr:CDP-alcohol phosphatidyltransferase family protein [Cryomorphaceae bacterium 1068]
MSKLPKAHKFTDLSDYGRPVAKLIANGLKNTSFTPIHVTLWFIISGLLAIYCILQGYYWPAAFFLIFKSILDAADGELARVKKKPSYTGRYLDSVADILLNALIFITIWHTTDTKIWIAVGAFIGLQLQGTLYNYYYVILRNKFDGDTTSRVFETKTPIALKGEKQQHVNVLFALYKLLYGAFDKTIYALDPHAEKGIALPKWFMTILSTFGLGFQLLVIAVMLVTGLEAFILPFFFGYTAMVFVFIGIRKFFFREVKAKRVKEVAPLYVKT